MKKIKGLIILGLLILVELSCISNNNALIKENNEFRIFDIGMYVRGAKLEPFFSKSTHILENKIGQYFGYTLENKSNSDVKLREIILIRKWNSKIEELDFSYDFLMNKQSNVKFVMGFDRESDLENEFYILIIQKDGVEIAREVFQIKK